MTGVFTINYPATMAVIDRMTKLVEKLKKINERYESKISTLSRCRGTTENPHNHDSQIASYRKIINNNSKDIVDLGLLISQIFSLMTNTKMTDFFLTQLIRGLMSGDSNVPNPETSVIDEDLTRQAAKAAGIGVTATGSPRIMSATDYQNYQAALTYLKSLEPLKVQAREYEAKGQYAVANAMNQYISSHTLKNIDEIKKYVDNFYAEIKHSNYLVDPRYISLKERTEVFNIEQYKKDFVLEIFPVLLEYEHQTGIPVEIMFGQICIESAYGEKTLIDKYNGKNANNYFGYKGTGTAGSVISDTSEYIKGEKIYIEDKFRAYNNLNESLDDYTDLLIRNYKQYASDGSPEDWADALVEGGYATAPNYGESVLNVARTWRVYQ